MNIRVLMLSLCALTAQLSTPARAQNCNGNIDLSGPYEFTVSRVEWTPVAFAPPGTTTGAVLAPGPEAAVRARQRGSLAIIGRLVADGSGALLAAASGSNAALAPAGIYSVSPDCSVTISFDGPPAEVPPGTPGGPAAVRTAFRGFLWNRGEEAVLLQTGLARTGEEPLVASQLKLERPFRFTGCSASSLSGLYGLTASGIARPAESTDSGDGNGNGNGGSTPGATLSPQPFSIAAQVLADGNGAFIAPVDDSSLWTGSYSVNSDCTGTATITGGAQPMTLLFVLVQDRTPNPSTSDRAAMRFVLRGAEIAGEGIAR
ncbi:MAG: hypothetical protein R2729_18410 [Bryobacteraceae bacterium]